MVSLQILDKSGEEMMGISGKRPVIKNIEVSLEKDEHIVGVDVGVWRYYP